MDTSTVASQPTTAPARTTPSQPQTQVGGGDGDHDRFAHYIRERDHLRGYVLGEEVEALCGKRWVPSRDPERYPVCPTCKEILARLGGRGADDDG